MDNRGIVTMKRSLVLVFFLLLGACVSRSQIASLEAENGGDYYQVGKTTTELLDDGVRVANAYLSLADKVATRMDGAALLNIALASGAAVSVINGANATTLSRIGVVGIAANQTSTYFDPVSSRDALTRAAKRQLCIVGIGRTYASSSDPIEKKIIADAFTKVRFFLRENLNRKPNNYTELFDAYTAVVEGRGQASLSGRSTANLETGVTKCLGAN